MFIKGNSIKLTNNLDKNKKKKNKIGKNNKSKISMLKLYCFCSRFVHFITLCSCF